jgi:hypothetical protein
VEQAGAVVSFVTGIPCRVRLHLRLQDFVLVSFHQGFELPFEAFKEIGRTGPRVEGPGAPRACRVHSSLSRGAMVNAACHGRGNVELPLNREKMKIDEFGTVRIALNLWMLLQQLFECFFCVLGHYSRRLQRTTDSNLWILQT